VTGDDGIAVALAAPPHKVVSLTPATSELMFALGAGDRLVGRTDYDDYPPEVASVPAVATFQGVEMEKVVNIGPDLVLAGGNGFTSAADIRRMRDLGFPVLVLYAPDVTGVLADIRLVGQAVGEDAAAQQITDSIQARIDEVTTAVADLSRPSTFYEISVDTEIYGPAPDSFVADMVGLAGGDPVTTTDPAVFSISLERIVSLDPQVIVLGDAAYGTCPEAVAARPGWKGINAVKSGTILSVDDTIVTRPGPRLGEGLAELALAIHPDAAIAPVVGAPQYCAAASPSPGPS
jgi:iron complex transport system substrate-binding protein